MPNRAMEIHDSDLSRISVEAGVAVLHFSEIYIHQSDRQPAIDPGSGWVQEAFIRITEAKVEGAFPEGSREGGSYRLSDGYLRVGDWQSDNLIPIPLDVVGDVELRIECWGKPITVTGSRVTLELIGGATYVEEHTP